MRNLSVLKTQSAAQHAFLSSHLVPWLTGHKVVAVRAQRCVTRTPLPPLVLELTAGEVLWGSCNVVDAPLQLLQPVSICKS
jgi:hypothetical protein